MIVEPINYIQRDERGIAWIADTKTKVIEVAMDQTAYGWDAAEIHAAHPHLSLAQIHAALSYYHDHQQEMNVQMDRQMEDYHRRRTTSTDQVTRSDLIKRLGSK